MIFIVATNRLRSFDAAVTRPGRFDFLLFVGTPNLLSREKRLVSRLEGTRLTAAKRYHCIYLFICLFIYLPNYLFIYSFIYSFIYLFIYLFIHLFIQSIIY